jgi:hypothetical protein
MTQLESTPLWKVFASKASDEQRVVVRRSTQEAADLLDRVIETFPTYTLHNRVHAINVVELMGNLLGDWIERITALEGAMLLFSAYHHDIGMVFDPAERQQVTNERWFQRFLDENPDAFLSVMQAKGDVPVHIVEWYCRWRHADRVSVYLDRLPPDALLWGRTSLKDRLATICKSHNQHYTDLRDDRLFRTDLLVGGERCDIRLCAVLLRLADILDFDNSRSPIAVYHQLGLERRSSPRETMSDVEWRKHLSAEGFNFPAEREAPYVLGFSAAPDLPAVEHDLRGFLDTIERELNSCAGIVRSCSARWRDLALPDRIDRSNIHSQGYKYGPYQFSLERQQVLELFMGENLYDSPYSFIRELLQNSIDTSRHRQFYEQSRGNRTFDLAPIRISEWRDQDHRHWIRIDDNGMGMDEDIITNYFLKVGSSYYKSSSFKAEVLRYKDQEGREFLPISRFGIGILSCFILCDTVEVATLHAADGIGKRGVRLSLSGLESFYTLQTEGDMAADPMPHPDGEKPGYRLEPGTSIAVRIASGKDRGDLDLRAIAEHYLLCPPVPVELDGERIGGDPGVLVDRPWTTPRAYPLKKKAKEALEGVLGRKLSRTLEVQVLPLDLTSASPYEEFRGQAVAVFLSGGEQLQQAMRPSQALRSVGLLDHRQLSVIATPIDLSVQRKLLGSGQGYAAMASEVESTLATSKPTSKPKKELLEALDALRRAARAGPNNRRGMFDAHISLSETVRKKRSEKLPWELPGLKSGRTIAISHNGIRVPSRAEGLWEGPNEYEPIRSPVKLRTSEGTEGFLVGCIQLSDRLRPEVSISRETVRRVPWNMHSVAMLSILRALDLAGEDSRGWRLETVFDASPFSSTSNVLELGTMLDDPLLLRDDGWASARVIEVGDGHRSLLEIRQAHSAGKSLSIAGIPTPDLTGMRRSRLYRYPRYTFEFARWCAAALLQAGVEVAWVRGAAEKWTCLVRGTDPPPLSQGLRLFPPLFFVPYEGSTLLRAGRRSLNRAHPFSKWFIEAAPTIRRNYPELFSLLRRTVASYSYQPSEVPDKTNPILDQLRRLDRNIGISHNVYLKPTDFDHQYEHYADWSSYNWWDSHNDDTPDDE